MDRKGRAIFPRRSKVAAICTALLLALLSCSKGPEAPITSLANGVEPFRDAFNQDVGKVRLLLLLDPT